MSRLSLPRLRAFKLLERLEQFLLAPFLLRCLESKRLVELAALLKVQPQQKLAL
jgi:hypothetical protein